MGNIIICGFKTNKLITQGYHSGEAAVGGDSSRYYYVTPPEKRDSRRNDLLLQVKSLLEALKS